MLAVSCPPNRGRRLPETTADGLPPQSRMAAWQLLFQGQHACLHAAGHHPSLLRKQDLSRCPAHRGEEARAQQGRREAGSNKHSSSWGPRWAVTVALTPASLCLFHVLLVSGIAGPVVHGVEQLCSVLSPALGFPAQHTENHRILASLCFSLKEEKLLCYRPGRVFYELMKGCYSNPGKYFQIIQSNSQLRIPFFSEHWGHQSQKQYGARSIKRGKWFVCFT